MNLLPWLVALAAAIVISWTVLPLLRADAWYVRIFEFPRVQITLISVATMLGYAVVIGWNGTRDQLVLAALATCIVYQLTRIVRYTRVYPKQVQDAKRPEPANMLNLMVANVLTTNRNAAPFLKLARERKPDLLLAVETDQWWQDQLDVLADDFPYTMKCPLDNLYGMHLYSRLPLIDPQLLFLVEEDVPSIHAKVRLRSGQLVQIHCLHPAPPSPTENASSAERDAELLLVASKLEKPARSAVVMGDLNDVAWSSSTRLFQHTSGLLDPRVGRGMFNTFHAGYPFLRWPLDHVFCSPDFTIVSLSRLTNIGSDHFPIGLVLCHAPAAVADNESLDADAQERQTAEQKIDKVDADREALDTGP